MFIHSFHHSFCHSFLPSFLPSFLRSYHHSFIHSFIRSVIHIVIHYFIYLFVYSWNTHNCELLLYLYLASTRFILTRFPKRLYQEISPSTQIFALSRNSKYVVRITQFKIIEAKSIMSQWREFMCCVFIPKYRTVTE